MANQWKPMAIMAKNENNIMASIIIIMAYVIMANNVA